MNGESKINAHPVTPPGARLGFWRAFHRHWQGSMRYYGPRHTVTQVAGAAYRFFREFLPGRRKAKYGDLDYDFDHNVDTTRANVGFREQLIAALTGHQYFPTEPWLFEQMMEALSTQQSAFSQETGLEDFTFVDLGSGKGRVLLMAAAYGFKRIIGVEFMPEWHRVALENVSKFMEIPVPPLKRGSSLSSRQPGADAPGLQSSALRAGFPTIECLCIDARDFDFPAGPLVVYLFNPFPEPVLAAVLDRLRHSLLQAPRPVFVAYRFPEFEPLLQKCGWLEKIAGTEQWAVYGDRRHRRHRA
jgi:SAM-dependent methyltransferase